MSVLKALEKARSLVKRGWCQQLEARTDDGEKCSPFSDEATYFCAIGSMIRASKFDFEKDWITGTPCKNYPLFMEMEKVFKKVNDTGQIVTWNDHPTQTKENVLSAFDKAIDYMRLKNEHIDNTRKGAVTG